MGKHCLAPMKFFHGQTLLSARVMCLLGRKGSKRVELVGSNSVDERLGPKLARPCYDGVMLLMVLLFFFFRKSLCVDPVTPELG